MRTDGKATAQALAQTVSHAAAKPSPNPTARNVAMAETSNDIKPDKKKPNTIGA